MSQLPSQGLRPEFSCIAIGIFAANLSFLSLSQKVTFSKLTVLFFAKYKHSSNNNQAEDVPLIKFMYLVIVCTRMPGEC